MAGLTSSRPIDGLIDEIRAMGDESRVERATRVQDDPAQEIDPEQDWDALVGHWVTVKVDDGARFFHGELSALNAGVVVVITKTNAVHPIPRDRVSSIVKIPKS